MYLCTIDVFQSNKGIILNLIIKSVNKSLLLPCLMWMNPCCFKVNIQGKLSVIDLNRKGDFNTCPCVVQWKRTGDLPDCWPHHFQVWEGKTLIGKYFLLFKKSLLHLSLLFPLSYELFEHLSIFIYRKERTRD